MRIPPIESGHSPLSVRANLVKNDVLEIAIRNKKNESAFSAVFLCDLPSDGRTWTDGRTDGRRTDGRRTDGRRTDGRRTDGRTDAHDKFCTPG